MALVTKAVANTMNFRKLGDGYTYYKHYTPTALVTPYGEPTMGEIMASQTFGGTGTNGAEIALEREIYEDEISQELAAIQRLVIGEKATFKVTVSAGRLDNIAVASGKTPASDIVATTALSAIQFDVQTLNSTGAVAKVVLIGGDTNLDYFAILHDVCNSVSPNLHEYIYAPRCQAADGFSFGFKKNEMRQFEFTINIMPALQDAFLGAGSCSNRHALFAVVYETA